MRMRTKKQDVYSVHVHGKYSRERRSSLTSEFDDRLHGLMNSSNINIAKACITAIN